MVVKVCLDCNIEKPFNEYHRDMSKVDGCATYCKICAKLRSNVNYHANREKRRAQQKAYKTKSDDEKERRYNIYTRKDPEKLKEYLKAYHIENKIYSKKKIEFDLTRRVQRLMNSRKSTAISVGMDYDLNINSMMRVLINQGNKCAVTGIVFDYNFSDEYRSAPFGPSIDRIDSNKGYTITNVRFVCFIVNLGKNQYPQSVFDEMCIARAKVLGYEKT